MNDLLDAVEKEKNNRFCKSWTKLDKGSKINRITIFIKEEADKNELNEEESKSLRKLLYHLCSTGSLNKINDVEYSLETFLIISIKNLKYDGKKKTYSFDLPKKTVKPTAKSKSKIDRHFSRSKENKK